MEICWVFLTQPTNLTVTQPNSTQPTQPKISELKPNPYKLELGL